MILELKSTVQVEIENNFLRGVTRWLAAFSVSVAGVDGDDADAIERLIEDHAIECLRNFRRPTPSTSLLFLLLRRP
jgi:hypothetical protein